MIAFIFVLCFVHQAQAHFSGAMDSPFYQSSRTSAVSYIAEGNSIVIEFQLPGLGAEDIDVALENSFLLVRKAETKAEEKKDSENSCTKKRKSSKKSGSVDRVITEIALPPGLDIESTDATMKNGLLKVIITRAKTKSIPIKVKG